MKHIYFSTIVLLMGNLAFSQSSNEKIGINTNAPENALHVVSDSDPLKLEGLQKLKENISLLVSSSDGVVKKIGGEALQEVFSIPRNSGASSITGTYMSDNNNNNITITFGNVTTNIVDLLSGYNPSTGIYTVSEDGLYHLSALVRFVVNVEKNPNHPISMDGRSMRMAVGFLVKSTDKEYRVGYVDRQIIRGLYIPDSKNTLDSNITNVALYFFQSNGTVWLKKGEQVLLRFITYGGIDPITTSDNGTKDPNRAFIDLNQSNVKIFRIL